VANYLELFIYTICKSK